jgi:hypothetical protein
MKRSLALLCVAAFLGGCSREPEEIPEIGPAPTPERTYRHPTHGFLLRVPDGWEIKDTGNTAPIVVSLVSPRKGPEDFRETITIQVEPGKPGVTAQQYFEESLAERRLIKDFQLIGTAPETIGKTEALGAITRLDLGGLVVQVLSYTIVHGKNVYTITAIAIPETFDEFKGIFRSVALAFEP